MSKPGSDPLLFANNRGARITNQAINLLALAAVIGQVMISADFANMICVCFVLASTLITTNYVFRPTVIQIFPMSALPLLGFNLTTQSGALIVQTLDFHELIYNLQVPITTFGNLAAVQLLAVSSHALYRRSPALRNTSLWIAEKIFTPLGVFERLSNAQMWVFGAIGFLAVSLGATPGVDTGGADDTFTKILVGFRPFLVVPFLIPILPRLTTPEGSKVRPSSVPLILYFIAVLILSFARNSRSIFALGLISLALAVLLIVVMGRVAVTRATVRKTIFAIGAIGVALVFLSQVAIAMLIVRDQRDRLSTTELIAASWDALNDAERIAAYKEGTKGISHDAGYEENYISDPMLARLIITKFHDNSFYEIQDLDSNQVEALWRYTWDRTLAVLPKPVIDLFDSSFDKATIVSYSFGDLLLSLKTGVLSQSFVSGSALAQGVAMMGYLYYLFFPVIILIYFVFFDSFSRRSPSGRFIIVAPIAIFDIFIFFTCEVSNESLPSQVMLLLRDFPQMILLYLIVARMTRPIGIWERNRLARLG